MQPYQFPSDLQFANDGDLIAMARKRLSGVKRYWYVPSVSFGIIILVYPRIIAESDAMAHGSDIGQRVIVWFGSLLFGFGVQRIFLKHLTRQNPSWADFFRFDSIFYSTLCCNACFCC